MVLGVQVLSGKWVGVWLEGVGLLIDLGPYAHPLLGSPEVPFCPFLGSRFPNKATIPRNRGPLLNPKL